MGAEPSKLPGSLRQGHTLKGKLPLQNKTRKTYKVFLDRAAPDPADHRLSKRVFEKAMKRWRHLIGDLEVADEYEVWVAFLNDGMSKHGRQLLNFSACQCYQHLHTISIDMLPAFS